jgi:hypothetical protein
MAASEGGHDKKGISNNFDTLWLCASSPRQSEVRAAMVAERRPRERFNLQPRRKAG